MPPPVAPVSFQVPSWNVEPATFVIVVPPQQTTNGSVPGYSTWARPSPIPQSEPSSPEETKTLPPAWNASSKAMLTVSISMDDHSSSSDPPQLMDSTSGRFT